MRVAGRESRNLATGIPLETKLYFRCCCFIDFDNVEEVRNHFALDKVFMDKYIKLWPRDKG